MIGPNPSGLHMSSSCFNKKTFLDMLVSVHISKEGSFAYIRPIIIDFV